jgi:hypothetical protein
MIKRFPCVLGVDWKALLGGRSSITVELSSVVSSGETPSSTSTSLSTAMSFLLGAPNRIAASLLPDLDLALVRSAANFSYLVCIGLGPDLERGCATL